MKGIASCLAAVVVLAGSATTLWAAAPTSDACGAGQIRCVRDETYDLLRCAQRCRQNAKECGSVQARCEDRAVERLGTGVAGGDGCLDHLAATGVCTTAIDGAAIDAHAKAAVADMIAGLDGTTRPTCGDGLVQGDEECDLGNLNGNTCASRGLFGSGLSCAPGCVLDTSLCVTSRFVDYGATIVDYKTGLEWEKKTDDGGVHDKDNVYTFIDFATGGAGTLFSSFLSILPGTLNDHHNPFFEWSTDTCFALHCDWRLPTSAELSSIVVFGRNPCIDPIFGPTASNAYWSLTRYGPSGQTGYAVSFEFCGEGVGSGRAGAYAVRAVRTLRAADHLEAKP